MKTTKNIWFNKTLCITVLTLGILVVSFFSQLTPTVNAASYGNTPGWYHGMVSVAENEIRSNEQKAIAEKDQNPADEITVADVDKGYLTSYEQKGSVEKADEVEN